MQVTAALLAGSWHSAPARSVEWLVAPQLSVQEYFTDNVLLSPTDRRSDFVTLVAPRLNITGDGPRVHAVLDYSPVARIYALTPQQDAIDQQLYANGNATVIDNLLFADARAYMAQQSTSGLLNPAGLPNVPRSERTEATSFSVSPYLSRRFDGYGTGQLRYTISDSSFTGGQNTLFPSLTPAAQNSRSRSDEETASFLTGDNSSRLRSRFVLDAVQSSGTGVLNNAAQNLATVDTEYALSRSVTVTGTIGYEDLRFSGIPPTQIRDAVWDIGAVIKPSTNVSLALRYGHQDGVNAPSADFRYEISPRAKISASYSESLGTQGQALVNNLIFSNVDAQGQTIDTRTQLPTLITNQLFALQPNNLLRTRLLKADGSLVFDRNTVTLTILRQEQSLVATEIPGTGTSQRATGAGLNLTRAINPLTNGAVAINYSTVSSPSIATTELLYATATITYALNYATDGLVSYSFISRTSDQARLRLLSNTLLVGITRRF
jgi:uncharacterized protein (PEP-CTERM system associated)